MHKMIFLIAACEKPGQPGRAFSKWNPLGSFVKVKQL